MMPNERYKKIKQKLMRFEGHTETLPKDRVTKKIPTVEFAKFGDIPLVNRSKKNTIVIVRGEANTKYGLYYDSEGKLTSGIGHLVKQGEIEAHYKLKEKAAKAMFDKDFEKHKKALERVSKNIGVDLNRLNSSQEDSLISMMFNTNLGKRKEDGSLSWKGMWGALKKATSPDTSPEEKEKYLSLAGYEMLNSKRFTQVKSRAVEEADVFFPEDFEKVKWNKHKRNIIRDIKKDRKDIYEILKDESIIKSSPEPDGFVPTNESTPAPIQPAPIGGYPDRQKEKIDNITLNLTPEDHQKFGRQPGRLYAKVQERNDEEIVGKEIKREQKTEGNKQTTQRIS